MYTIHEKKFKEVITEDEQRLFNTYWQEVCLEVDVPFLPFHPNSQRFFIMDDREIVGTIEFTKRQPHVFSVCEDFFSFKEHDKVIKDESQLYEVGKISITKEHRRNGHIDKIIELINLHAELNKVKQYIGFMNVKLHRILVLSYGLRLEKLGEVVEFERVKAVPVLCDVEKAKKRIRKKLSI